MQNLAQESEFSICLIGIDALCSARCAVKPPHLGKLLIGRTLVMWGVVAAEHVDNVTGFLVGKIQVCRYIQFFEVTFRESAGACCT